MFKFLNKKRDSKNQEKIEAFICYGCFFEGNITIGEGITRIDGQIQGNIKGEGGLLIGEKGIIKGDVEVKKVILYGQIFGNVKTEEIELYSGSVIKGNIKTKSIFIEKGAIINGFCEMEYFSDNI